MLPLTLVTRTNPTGPFYFYNFDITQLFERKEFSQVQVSKALSSFGSSLLYAAESQGRRNRTTGFGRKVVPS